MKKDYKVGDRVFVLDCSHPNFIKTVQTAHYVETDSEEHNHVRIFVPEEGTWEDHIRQPIGYGWWARVRKATSLDEVLE